MLNLKIDTKGLNPKFIEQLEAQKKAQLRQAIRPRAIFVWKQAKAFAPVWSGQLKRSIEMQAVDDTYLIGTRCPWGGYQEYGTRHNTPVAYLRRAVAAMLLQFRKIFGK